MFPRPVAEFFIPEGGYEMRLSEKDLIGRAKLLRAIIGIVALAILFGGMRCPAVQAQDLHLSNTQIRPEREVERDLTGLIEIAQSAAQATQGMEYEAPHIFESELGLPFQSGDFWLKQLSPASIRRGESYRARFTSLVNVSGAVQIYAHFFRYEYIDTENPVYDYQGIGRFAGLLPYQEVDVDYPVKGNDASGLYQVILTVYHEETGMYYHISTHFVVGRFINYDDTGTLRVDEVGRKNIENGEVLDLLGSFHPDSSDSTQFFLGWFKREIRGGSYFRLSIPMWQINSSPGVYDLVIGHFRSYENSIYSEQQTVQSAIRIPLR